MASENEAAQPRFLSFAAPAAGAAKDGSVVRAALYRDLTVNHILLVDNEEEHANLVLCAFRQHADDFQVTWARRLSDARTALSESQPDLMVVDLDLPDGRGTELLPTGKAAQFPILLMTSSTDEPAGINATNAGALDYLVKSAATLADMPHLARRALREWRLILEHAQAREREEQLLAQLAHVERRNTMGELATVLAHETTQPLAAIASDAGTCVELLDADRISREQLRQACSQIYQQARRAGKIIQRLRRFVAKSTPRRSWVDPNQLVQEACGLLISPLQADPATIQLKLDDSLPDVRVDALQVQQVLVNLIQNALEAVKDAAPERRRLTVTTAVASEGVGIEVADRGPGLSPEANQRLFEPYFTTKPNGLGMGLHIARRIIEAHGGKLSVVSNADDGTTCRFTLAVDRRV